MWKIIPVAFAAVVAALAADTARASNAPAYQAVLDKAVAAGEPGVQAYVRQGDRRWFGDAGLSSVEDRRPMTGRERLRLASLTKMLTYAATMQLVEQGRIRLEDKAAALLAPGTLAGVPHAREITVQQLLDHRSGLYNFNGSTESGFFRDLYGDPNWGRRIWRPEQLIAYAKRPGNRPSGEPGGEFAYSSTGYAVLQLILERAQGAPLAQVYRRQLFDPLGMTGAGFEGGDLTAAQIADSYARPDEADRSGPSPFGRRRPVRADGLVNLSRGLTYYNAWAGGAGAVAANVHDIGAFMDAVTSNRVTVLKDQAGEFARAAKRPKAFFDWNGGSRGIQTTILYAPAADVAVVVLTNASNAGPSSHDMAKSLLDLARGS